MPYIENSRREALEADGGLSGASLAKTAGELNYCLTMVCKSYLDTHGKRYQTINDVLGALEGAKLEFYRRIGVPYEDVKRDKNGDVYE